ncbi:GlxA family transcriptional regulator [Brachybacterium alimentarium]|uniref:GlxA family transcriptional regulator n=1 Tax=Brachybacterium alimentarium TaxID=47845 RepID=UPI003FD45B17
MRARFTSMNAVRDHRVAVLILDGAKALDVGIAAHVFAKRPSMPYEVRVCGEQVGTVEGWNGLGYAVSHDLEALAWADTVLVPGYRNPADTTTPSTVIAALRAAHERGTRIAAISTGAFTLAAAGLLDGHLATTHWHYTHILHEQYPTIDVDENVLFVDAGQVLTSAGAASGIDLCLHLIRRDHGVALANRVARRLVSAPYRSGGQAQYVPRSIPEPLGDVFAATRAWALAHLHGDLSLTALARQANVSPRTFSRRFTADTGITPMQWVLRARIDHARELLERTDLTVTQIADASGLRSDTNLRRHFGSIVGTSPTAYRAAFQEGTESRLGVIFT